MMFNYKKIMVIGCCGSGKSTFSRKLAEVTGLPLYHLDLLYWQADKTHLEMPEFIEKQTEIFNNDCWIIDGNYRRTIPLRYAECDLCIFFDLPKNICIDGVMTRDANRADMPCVLIPSKDLISEIKHYKRRNFPIIKKARKQYPNKKFIVFKSRQEADLFLDKLKEQL